MADDNDAHLIEPLLHTEPLFQGNFLNVQRDTVRLPTGKSATREYIRHPGAVAVVPVLDDGRVVMVRQYRAPLKRVLLEFPAGKLDPGESPLVCGARELAEETGYRATEFARTGVIHNAAAYSDEGIEIWFARGLTLGQQRLDEGEHLDVVLHTLDELDALAASNALTDAKTLIGLLWLHRWRAGAWDLPWQPAPTL